MTEFLPLYLNVRTVSGASHGMTAKISKRFLCIYLNLLQEKTISTASG
ncbi:MULTISPECIES: hypothetical protein [unclassified Rickettsia]